MSKSNDKLEEKTRSCSARVGRGQDASAALGVIKRPGLGKTCHIDSGFLWIQRTAAERRLRFGKTLGRNNPTELCAEYLDWETIRRHSEKISVDVMDGRAYTAPKLHTIRALLGGKACSQRSPTPQTNRAMSKLLDICIAL